MDGDVSGVIGEALQQRPHPAVNIRKLHGPDGGAPGAEDRGPKTARLTDGRNEGGVEGVLTEPEQKASFTHAAVSDQQ